MELYVKTRKEWRDWLEKNHGTVDEVWLRYYKKPSGKPRIPYADAVEEALCFGWIDGKINKINDYYYIQRFTPRRTGSRWSKYNVDRIQKLIGNGLMKPAGIKAYEESLHKPYLVYDSHRDENPETPADLSDALNLNAVALRNFNNFSLSSRRIFIDWLNTAKKPETRIHRIEKIISLSEKNIKPRMGVI